MEQSSAAERRLAREQEDAATDRHGQQNQTDQTREPST
jgi:hypothetical protein